MKKSLVIDFMRTLYDPMTSHLYPGVKAMLADMHSERRMLLYSRQQRSRDGLIEELGISECFEGAYFVEQKTAENLKGILDTHEIDPRTCIVIGDMLAAELAAGNALGAQTVWFNQGIFAEALIPGISFTPDHTVASIPELHKLLKEMP